MSCTARKVSMALAKIVRERGRVSRAICIGIVDAPLTRRPARAFDHAARTIAPGFTPGCRQNHRSSDATTARTSSGGNSSSSIGMRTLPSGGRMIRNGAPLRS